MEVKHIDYFDLVSWMNSAEAQSLGNL